MNQRICAAAIASITLCLFSCASSAQKWAAVVGPQNSTEFAFVDGTTPVASLGLGGWGPNWQWVGLESHDLGHGGRLQTDVPFVVDRNAGKIINIHLDVSRASQRSVVFQYKLAADVDVPTTMVIAPFNIQAVGSKVTLHHADGKLTDLKTPFGRGSYGPTTSITIDIADRGQLKLELNPPLPVAIDGDMRIMFATDVFHRGVKTAGITVTFPGNSDLLTSKEDMNRLSLPIAGASWYPFAPSDKAGPTIIGMEDWLEKPAGKHGGVRIVGDHFEFEDKTPVKFWGMNLSYGGGCAPEKLDAEFTAAKFAKYGVNGVRLHKFSYPTDQMGIGDPNDATRMSPERLDKLDYFSSELKNRGIYFGWSHTYGFHVCPGNRGKLLAYDEIAQNLKGNTYGLINFAEDVQDLMIEMVVNLLKHQNPYTGKSYAQEPALSFIELQNEDDIFFYTSESAFNACPTYKKRFISEFCNYLKTKYGSQDRLKAAWQEALAGGESIESENITPQTNPWFFGSDHLPSQSGGNRQRLLDTAAWLHQKQNRFYSKFVKAIRTAGYAGPLCGSPWQAPAMLPHYYNLYSDYQVGYIDRHNYFGGGLNDTMLTQPGSGYFSSGLQQVTGRPFGLSEWIHVYPSLYSAEGPFIMAAYGLGLQGWGSSYEFQSSSAHRMFSDRAGWQPWGVWDADTPTSLGQYPALSRMILRRDVAEASVISNRAIAASDLDKGEFGFKDSVSQQGDVKTFGGAVPPEALAAGKVVVSFNSKSDQSVFPDMSKFKQGTAIRSATGQLTWDTAGKGFITVNTAGTKALVGFVGGKTVTLGNVQFEIKTDYASLELTALDRTSTLANAHSALLTAIARTCNTGSTYYAIDRRILENGHTPILLEPVVATVKIQKRQIDAVNVLDHDGRRTGRTVPVQNGSFNIDGAVDRTMYYEVIFR